jgi:hypothetical protein
VHLKAQRDMSTAAAAFPHAANLTIISFLKHFKQFQK